MGFEKFFDSHMQDYIGKLKMIKWNRFDTDCKNECLRLEMLQLRKNKRNDLCIFFACRDVRKLTCLTAKFQEDPVEPLQEVAWRSYGI